MKQHIISLCMLVTAFGSHSVAQTGKINQDVPNSSSDVEINPVFAKPATAKKITNVNSKALYSFQKTFKDANDVNWYAADEKEKTYVVFFNSEKNPSMALFQKRGNLLYAITHCAESDLPAENRIAIKSNYVDYKITYVKKVTVGNKTAWIANLENEKKLVIVKSIEGQIEEMENYDLSKN